MENWQVLWHFMLMMLFMLEHHTLGPLTVTTVMDSLCKRFLAGRLEGVCFKYIGFKILNGQIDLNRSAKVMDWMNKNGHCSANLLERLNLDPVQILA